jgi:hypothetical protein
MWGRKLDVHKERRKRDIGDGNEIPERNPRKKPKETK